MCDRRSARARRLPAAMVTPLLALGLCATAPARAGALPAEAAALLRVADAARAPLRSGVTRVSITRRAPGSVEELGELDVYAAGERALVVFRSGVQQGRRLLVVEGKSWLIVPGTRHAVALSGQQRLAGTAAIADLVGPPLSGRYVPTLRPGTEEVEGEPCRILALAALATGEPYPSAVLWLSVTDGVPRRLRLRLGSGRDARELRFAYRREDAGPILVRLEIRDLLRRREETTVLELGHHDPRVPDPAVLTVDGARTLP